ncbi:hypothetical protein B0H19DRAFT_1244052 [Mycena capillaripes]|nr:hypothetical protein B0H19DRAFT_1244052 [Mycena capillaripes]
MVFNSASLPDPAAVIFNSPPFPPELTDIIIDLVAVQKAKRVRANLAACSLVCHVWLNRSRRHFFDNCRLLLARHNMDGFATLIRSPLCTIRPYVHQLSLRNSGYDRFDNISDALAQLTRVVSLRLIGSDWEAHGAPPRLGFMQSLPNVVDLEVDCAEVGDLDHALQIFCAFPALSSLSIKSLAVKEERLWSVPYAPASYLLPSYVTPPPHLSSLRIEAPAVIHILHWMNWGGSSRITTFYLRLTACGHEDAMPLRQFLQSQSVSLEDCTLIYTFPRLNQEELKQTFDFRAFTRLKHLHLGPLFGLLDRDGPYHLTIPWIIHTLTSPVLARLTLELDGERFDMLPDLPSVWTPVDTFLSDKVKIAPGTSCPSFSLRFVAPVPPSPRGVKSPITTIPTLPRYARAVGVLTTTFPRLQGLGALDFQLDALKTHLI